MSTPLPWWRAAPDTIVLMARRRRSTVKWIVTTVAVALSVLSAASSWYFVGWVGPNQNSACFVRTGLIFIDWTTGIPPVPTFPEEGWVLFRWNSPEFKLWAGPYHHSIDATGGSLKHRAIIPVWIPLLALWLVAAGLWITDGRRKPGGCSKCGYDLSGLGAGACPECGQAQSAPMPEPKS